MIPRKQGCSLYLWVYLGKEPPEGIEPSDMQKNQIMTVKDLFEIPKWTADLIDVSGKYSDSVIHKAISKLQEWTDEEVILAILDYKKRTNNIGPNYLKTIEKDFIKGVEGAKKNNQGILYL